MKIRRIVPNIPSTKMEESKRFYIDYLGLKLVMDMGWVMTFASASNSENQITIVQNDQKMEIRSDVTITVEVEDVDGAFEKATEPGIPVTYPIANEPWGVRRFFVLDPNGVTINIMSHKVH